MEKTKSQIVVIVAIIGLIGTLGSAIISRMSFSGGGKIITSTPVYPTVTKPIVRVTHVDNTINLPHITEPKDNSVITIRKNFPVAGSIPTYNEDRAMGFSYWISIASVSNNEPILHWPKFTVKEAQFKRKIYDGGENPLTTPQPMKILLLKVDEAVNHEFTAWLENGMLYGYEGLPVDASQIVASLPIYFP